MNKHPHTPQEQVEEIERFIMNEMPPDEQRAFAERVAADAALKKAVAEIQLLCLGVQEAALERRLDAFHEGVAANGQGTKKGRTRILSLKLWLVAASAAGIIAVAAWLLLFRPNAGERLFAEYYQPDTGLLTAMGTADDYAFERAMVDYKTGDYAAAIRGWKPLQEAAPTNDTLNYFLGSAHLAAGAPEAALPYLRDVLPGSTFRGEAQWYLGLALLKMGDMPEAAAAINRSNHPQKDALLTRLSQQKLR